MSARKFRRQSRQEGGQLYANKEEGRSDVCVYYSYDGYLICADCALTNEKYAEFSTTEDICAHLESHEDKGHNIPEGLARELWEDDRQNFWWLQVADHYPEDWEEEDDMEWYEKDEREYY